MVNQLMIKAREYKRGNKGDFPAAEKKYRIAVARVAALKVRHGRSKKPTGPTEYLELLHHEMIRHNDIHEGLLDVARYQIGAQQHLCSPPTNCRHRLGYPHSILLTTREWGHLFI